MSADRRGKRTERNRSEKKTPEKREIEASGGSSSVAINVIC